MGLINRIIGRFSLNGLYSIIYFAIALSFPLLSALHYSSNDEDAMRVIVDGSYLGYSDAHLVFMNIAYGYLLKGLYSIANIDWISLGYYLLIVSGLYVVWQALQKRIPPGRITTLAFVLICFLLIESLNKVNFTIVAAVAAIAGLALYEITRGSMQRTWLTRLLAVLFIVMGIMIRADAFLLVLLVYGAWLLIFNSIGDIISRTGWLASLVLLFVCIWGADKLYYQKLASEPWQNYMHNIEVKRPYMDGKALSYTDLPDGWCEEDRLLLESFFYEQQPKYSLDSLLVISETLPSGLLNTEVIGEKLDGLTIFRDYQIRYFSMSIIPFLLLILLSLNKKYLLRSLLLMALVFGLIFMVYLYLKLPYRVFLPFNMALLVLVLLGSFPRGYVPRIPMPLFAFVLLGAILYNGYYRYFQYLKYGRLEVQQIEQNRADFDKLRADLPEDTKIICAGGHGHLVNMKLFADADDRDFYRNMLKMGWNIGMPTNERYAVAHGFIPEEDAPVYYHAVNRDDIMVLATSKVMDILPGYFNCNYNMTLQIDTVEVLGGSGLYRLKTADKTN